MGRKAKVTGESYLKAVLKVKSLDDIAIAERLGIDRSNVYRFRMNEENKEIIETAKLELDKIINIRFDGVIEKEKFESLSVISDWMDMLIKKGVPDSKRKHYSNALYNVCMYLKISPDNLTIELASDLMTKTKREKIKGISYEYCKKALRSYFQIAKRLSGQILTSYGIKADKSLGEGSLARQKVTKEQRRLFESHLKDVIYEKVNNGVDKEMYYLEALNGCIFMHTTATRATATINARFDLMGNAFSDQMLSFEIWDKGVMGRQKRWDKIMIGYIKDSFREYIKNRFGVSEISEYNKLEYLFPLLRANIKRFRNVVKEALLRSGCKTTIPLHIWRHTFAQDFLSASDWNYELCASIGGWTETKVLKMHYGQMGELAKMRGLRKAMGLPVEDVTYELRW